jgi:hypothetical protein
MFTTTTDLMHVQWLRETFNGHGFELPATWLQCVLVHVRQRARPHSGNSQVRAGERRAHVVVPHRTRVLAACSEAQAGQQHRHRPPARQAGPQRGTVNANWRSTAQGPGTSSLLHTFDAGDSAPQRPHGVRHRKRLPTCCLRRVFSGWPKYECSPYVGMRTSSMQRKYLRHTRQLEGGEAAGARRTRTTTRS